MVKDADKIIAAGKAAQLFNDFKSQHHTAQPRVPAGNPDGGQFAGKKGGVTATPTADAKKAEKKYNKKLNSIQASAQYEANMALTDSRGLARGSHSKEEIDTRRDAALGVLRKKLGADGGWTEHKPVHAELKSMSEYKDRAGENVGERTIERYGAGSKATFHSFTKGDRTMWVRTIYAKTPSDPDAVGAGDVAVGYAGKKRKGSFTEVENYFK